VTNKLKIYFFVTLTLCALLQLTASPWTT